MDSAVVESLVRGPASIEVKFEFDAALVRWRTFSNPEGPVAEVLIFNPRC